MRVTIGKNKYGSITAATYDEVFKHLIADKHGDLHRALYLKSLDKHKGRLDDAKAEWISYLAHRYQDKQQELIDAFNRNDFTNIAVGALVYHVSTLTHPFNKKYSFDQGKSWTPGKLFTPVELDHEECHMDLPQTENEPQHEDDEQYADAALSISQYLQLIRFVLRSDEALERFKKRDLDFYFEFFCVPYSQGTRVTIKAVAKEHKIVYGSLLNRVKPIKEFVRQKIRHFVT